MKKKLKKIYSFVGGHYKICIAICLILSTIPFIIISYYSRPCADDFSHSYRLRQIVIQEGWKFSDLMKAAWDTELFYFNYGDGPYVSNFILSFQPGIWGEKFYGWGTICLMVLAFLCTYYFIKTLFCFLNFSINNLLGTLFLFVILINGIPSTVEGLYWFDGAWNYIPAFFLTLVNIALVMRYFYGGKKAILYIVFSTIISFIVSGGHVVVAFLNILLLFTALIFSVLIKKKLGGIFTLISATSGFLINVYCPGSRERANLLNQSGVVKTIFISIFQTYWSITKWIDFKYIMVLMILILIIVLNDLQHKIKKIPNPLLTLILSYGLICALWCVPIYAMSSLGEGRLHNVIWLTFEILSMLNWCIVVLWLLKKINFETGQYFVGKNMLKFSMILICILCCFCGGSNSFSISFELLNGTAKTYAMGFDARIELMKDAQKKELVVVDPLPESINLNFSDISYNINNWKNVAWKKYYGVDTVRRKIIE